MLDPEKIDSNSLFDLYTALQLPVDLFDLTERFIFSFLFVKDGIGWDTIINGQHLLVNHKSNQ